MNYQFIFCFSADEEPGPIARMPTDELMNSEVAILTGICYAIIPPIMSVPRLASIREKKTLFFRPDWPRFCISVEFVC